MSKNEELPSGWLKTTLGELALDPKSDIVDGPFGSRLKATEYVNEGLPIIRIQNIERNKFIQKNLKFVTAKKTKELQRHSYLSGDIVITKLGDPLGKACFVPPEMEHGLIVADIVRVRIKHDFIFEEFLVYQINSTQVSRQLAVKTKGTTRPRVNLSHVRALEILVPPLNEQKRIVSKIEELFTKLDAGEAELRKAKEQVKLYKKSILKSAVEGKLTEEWRKEHQDEIEPASVLLEKILKERRVKWEEEQLKQMEAKGKVPKDDKWKKKYKEPIKLQNIPTWKKPDEWCFASLDQIFMEKTVGLVKSQKEQNQEAKGIRYLKMNNVTTEGQTDLENLVFVEATKDEINKYKLENGDIVFNTRNSFELVGKTGLIKSLSEVILYNNNLIRFRTGKHMSADFVVYQMISILFKEQLESVKKATTNIAALYAKDVMPLALYCPPLQEQLQIVKELDRCFSLANEALAVIKKELIRCQRLKQSILKKAFSGKLVSQRLNDEPASSLLEKIKKEKTILEQKAKTTGKKKSAEKSKTKITKKTNKTEQMELI